MRLKKGVRVEGLSAVMIPAYLACARIIGNFEQTSGSEGRHMVGSKHHSGRAFDVGIKNMSETLLARYLKELKEALPGYDVIREKTHIHIEYDPK